LKAFSSRYDVRGSEPGVAGGVLVSGVSMGAGP
jgi:hypothetical protein